MAVRRTFLGTWEVTKFQYEKENENIHMEGVKFRLDEFGNVDWTVKEELSTIPLFQCDTYEVCSTRTCAGIDNLRLRFGAFAGHVIEFKCYRIHNRTTNEKQVRMVCEGWCDMNCNRIAMHTPHCETSDIPFSLLPALEDGYFQDIIITSANSKQFEVHATILHLLGDSLDWHDPVTTALHRLPENVLGTILHFLYTECLPSAMEDDTAAQVIQAISTYECLNNLSDLCRTYLKNNELKRQVIGLVNEMHSAINKVIEHFLNFNAATSSDEEQSGPCVWGPGGPSQLCFILKQALRDTAVVCGKLLLLCDLFSKRKNDLSRDDRHEIILYANSRVPILVMQVLKFFKAIKRTFSCMTSVQRQEVAMFLVPEVDTIFDTITDLVRDANRAMQMLVDTLSPHQIKQIPNASTDNGTADISKALFNLFFNKEVFKCRAVQEIITGTLQTLISKKENFNEMTQTQKIRTVTRNFDQLIEELTFFLIQLEELPSALDDKLELSEFKFCFKVGTSKVSGILDTLVKHRDVLQTLLYHVIELVQRDTFKQTLQKLELLIVPSASSTSSNSSATHKFRDIGNDERKTGSTPKHQQQPHSYQLSLVNALCVPPSAKRSNLARKCLELFKSEKATDMVFEVLSATMQDDETHQEPAAEERTYIKAHRVIVASRCDWFRRALQSGMRESIDRKIVIHDTSPFLFRVFLEYLYSGQIDASLALSTEQYSDLLLLSDRYELDSLKQLCEYALQSSIDMETALYYLSMADQFNATLLRSACIMFISQNHELTENELFYELPIALQAEIFDSMWTQPQNNQKRYYSDPSDESFTDNLKRVGDINLSGSQLHSNESSVEDLPSQDSARMQLCLSQMRDILGDAAPHEALVQVILAADYDLCRAINYFYARHPTDEY